VSAGSGDHPQEAMRRAARARVRLGWRVFPCAVGGKQPALRGSWEERATTKTDVIEMWWRLHPYNIGIACGPSGLVVLDLDVPRHGKAAPDGASGQPAGTDTFLRLCSEHGQPVPATFTVRTPSRGYHLYFTDPEASVRKFRRAARPADRRARSRRVRGGSR
jgi:Bifunctional DNA primase/polymerase, N-terminal